MERCCVALFVLLSLLADRGFSATHDSPGAQRIRFHTLGVEHGLPQATVRTMVQDHDGFVWLATQDGLARFDAYDIEVFRHQPGRGEGLGDSHITALAVAADGTLWIGTQSGGLARRDPSSGELSALRAGGPEGLASDEVTALTASGNGILVATVAGVQRWQADGFRLLEPAPGRATGAVRKLHETPSGELLIAAQRGAWRCSDGGCREFQHAAAPRGLDAHDLLDEGARGLWIAAEQGLFRFDSAGMPVEHLHGESQPALVHTQARALLRDRRDRLWVATMNGLAMREGDVPTLHAWRHQPGRLGTLAASRLQSLLEDRDGLLWFGTWTEGLSMLDPLTEAFVALAPDSDDPLALPGPGLAATFADADGTLWFGVLGDGGLVHFDPARGLIAHYRHDPGDPTSLSHNFVQHLTRDRRGRLWVATQGGGLNRLHENGRGFDRFRHRSDDPHSLPGDYLLHVYADSRNTLWIAGSGSGLAYLCDGCDGFRRLQAGGEAERTLAESSVNSVFEDSQGRLWIALRPGGLVVVNGDGGIARIVAEPGVPGRLGSNTLTAVFEDSRGGIWLGTQGGGLYALEEFRGAASRFRRYARSEGLGADAIGGILEDRQGRLWISTTTGLSRLHPGSGAIRNFGAREGAQSSGYFINSHGQLPDGRMVFGGLRGATLFDPDRVPPRRPPGPVVVSRITSHGANPVHADPLHLADRARAQGTVTLEHPANDLLVEFSALAFAAADATRYRFRLDGHDENWIETPARRRFAAYTNLRPGRYRFRVAALGEGRAGTEATFELKVGASPWQHPLAWIVYALAALALVAAFGWQRLARWREQTRAQLALRESEERLKLALWGTGDELWDIDLGSGALRRLNPLPHIAASRDTYVARASSLREYMHPDDLAGFDAAFAAHLRGDTASFEVAYRVRDTEGGWRWLRCRGRVVQRDTRGKPLRIAGTIGDIHALKCGELELHALNQALEQRVADRTADLTRANAALQETVAELRLAQRHLVESEKMAALGGLVAGVAHEINTPIGIGVTAASHLQSEARRLARRLQSGEPSRNELAQFSSLAEESIDMILRNLERADKLVRSFKQVAVDQGSEEHREIDLGHYLDEILTSLRPALKNTRIEVALSCPAELRVTTLPGALYQIMVNLVMNSLLHGYEPQQRGRIRIEAARHDDAVTLSYSDDGRGMSEEACRRIFEPFFTTRRGRGGSGLGMHIVYNLVTQALRGSIECDSAPGRGIYVAIRFPPAQPVAASTPVEA